VRNNFWPSAQINHGPVKNTCGAGGQISRFALADARNSLFARLGRTRSRVAFFLLMPQRLIFSGAFFSASEREKSEIAR